MTQGPIVIPPSMTPRDPLRRFLPRSRPVSSVLGLVSTRTFGVLPSLSLPPVVCPALPLVSDRTLLSDPDFRVTSRGPSVSPVLSSSVGTDHDLGRSLRRTYRPGLADVRPVFVTKGFVPCTQWVPCTLAKTTMITNTLSHRSLRSSLYFKGRII